ncbi:MAG: hypothetical protein ACRDTF_09455 [Pseudonocardiaceae bacterium]
MHGMLLVGTHALYLSHLPMFAPPHDSQLCLEVQLRHEDADPHDVYLRDRADTGTALYTLVPEVFALRELIKEPGAATVRTSFGGQLWRGHFERGGDLLLDGLTVEVVDLPFFEKLELPGGDPRPTGDLEYICFGKPSERFLAHRIVGPPDFDQIVAIRIADPEIDEMTRRMGPVLVKGRDDRLSDRLQPGETIAGSFFQTIGPQGQHGFSTDLTVDQELYLEFNELSS